MMCLTENDISNVSPAYITNLASTDVDIILVVSFSIQTYGRMMFLLYRV